MCWTKINDYKHGNHWEQKMWHSRHDEISSLKNCQFLKTSGLFWPVLFHLRLTKKLVLIRLMYISENIWWWENISLSMSAAKSSPVAGTRQPLTDNYRASRSDGPVSRTAVKPYGPGKPPNNQRHRGMVIPAWWVTHPHPLQHGMEMVGWSFPATQNTCSLNFISKTNTHSVTVT